MMWAVLKAMHTKSAIWMMKEIKDYFLEEID